MIIDDGGELTYEEARADVVKREAEETAKLSFIGRLKHAIKSFLYSPQHVKVVAQGASAVECLRNLERRAGLPEGDLKFNGQNYKCGNGFSSGVRHLADSKTSGKWKADGRPGYVSASVYEVTSRSFPWSKFEGRAHVSRNCPGVAAEGKCVNCGHIFENW